MENIQVMIWFAALGIMVAAAAAVLRGRQPWRRAAAFLLAGGLLQLLPFSQIGPALGGPLLLTVLAFAFAPRSLWQSRPRALWRDDRAAA